MESEQLAWQPQDGWRTDVRQRIDAGLVLYFGSNAALAARDLSGSLTVSSDGPGLGATFTLDLPAQYQQQEQPKAVAHA
jgi:hypothetical protein